jgi:hypothetical protein
VKRTFRYQLTAQAGPLLQPGEQVQAISWGQVVRPSFGPLASFRVLWSTLLGRESVYRVVVATDRRILVCRGGKFRKALLPVVLAELPRKPALGPARHLMFGLWHYIDVPDERIYIARWLDETAKADAASATTPG